MSLPLLEQATETRELPSLGGLTRSSQPYSRRWAAILMASDLVVFCGALLIAGIIGYGNRHIETPILWRIAVYDAVYVALWLVIFERLGLYRRTAALTARDELYFTVAALTIGVVPQLLLFTIVPTISSSRVVLLYAFAISLVGAGLARSALHAVRKASSLRRPRRIAIVGSSERIEQVRAALAMPNTATLLVPVENIDREYDANLSGDLSLKNIPWLYGAFAWQCDTIVFADIPPPRVIPHLLEAAALHQIRIAFAPPRIRRQCYALSLEIDGDQALIVPERLKACTPRARLLKRLIDVVLGSIALVAFSPVMALCAAGILLETGRPVFYRQQRVGINGRAFDILKFRSMRVDAEAQCGAVWAAARDERCTRVGALIRRMSFDELPQLINVLRGEMSLVGPRPERPVFVEAFRAAYPRYDERHLVRPGITGFSQMQMRRVLSTGDVGQKLTFDLYYVEQWSVFMDLSLLIRTAVEFLFQRAA
jgi:exopolysaccharide biosynthesis polyprenyl glycosylphosphotransferase